MTLEEKQKIILEIIDILLPAFSIELINSLIAEYNLAPIEEDSPDKEYDLMFLLKYESDELVLKIKEELKYKIDLQEVKKITLEIVDQLVAFCTTDIINDFLKNHTPPFLKHQKYHSRVDITNALNKLNYYQINQIKFSLEGLIHINTVPTEIFKILQKTVKNSISENFKSHIKKLNEEISNYRNLEKSFGKEVADNSYIKISKHSCLYHINSEDHRVILEKENPLVLDNSISLTDSIVKYKLEYLQTYSSSKESKKGMTQKEAYILLLKDKRRAIPIDIYSDILTKARKMYPLDYINQLPFVIKQKEYYQGLSENGKKHYKP